MSSNWIRTMTKHLIPYHLMITLIISKENISIKNNSYLEVSTDGSSINPHLSDDNVIGLKESLL